MIFTRYSDIDTFGADVLEILLENEEQNSLPISFINNKTAYNSNWFLASVKDDTGGVVLTAACTPPYNIIMYETRNYRNNDAVKLLANELISAGIVLPGVLSEQGLALRFAEAYAGHGGYQNHMSQIIMRLDKINEIEKAPGRYRVLCEDDLFFVPYWELAFSEECEIEVFDIITYIDHVKMRLGKDAHYIWEDGKPVSQAYRTKETPSGTAISGVYTPPHYRGKGYASSVVSVLSKMILEQGKYSFLHADASNPVSCSIYRKIGYYDLCSFDEIHFTNAH